MSIVSRLLVPRDREPDGPLVIEPMRRRHVKPVLAIEGQVYPRPWTAGVFTSELDQARRGLRHYLVALSGSRLVGYAGIMVLPDECHITNIAVDPSEHRRGIGRRLLVELASLARAEGAEAMSLEVRVSNTAAQALYRSFGFAPAGVRHRYYENTEDAIVMWVHDIQSDEYAERLRRIGGES